jgi:molybdopterin-guanine dinucleotide biosynthesis protein A
VTTIGIFVGGHSRRMGGLPKGLLTVPGEERSILERTLALAREISPRVVLVGRPDAYAEMGVPSLPDPDGDMGPLGGLLSLLEHAQPDRVIALACDMPHLGRELLARLDRFPSGAAAVAPVRDGRWEPFLARFEAHAVAVVRRRLSSGARSLHGLLDELEAVQLPLLPGESMLLQDWDCPEDMA